MKKTIVILGLLLVATLKVAPAWSQARTYPPLSQYMMERDAEIALAKSAAPAIISDRATIKVLTASGLQVVREGDNGFVCMVMRGWTAPAYTPVGFRDLVYDATLRGPICFDPAASRTILPYYELKQKLGMEGKTPDLMAEAVQAAYVKGELPKRAEVSFAYMWSADQVLGPAGHWHPHMMVFAPYFENSMLGGDNISSTLLPQVSDDAGTPFSVIVIPVDDKLAVKAEQR